MSIGMFTDQETTYHEALGTLHYGEDFCRAAIAVSNAVESDKLRQIFKDFVPYHLHTHSIELAMKGFLRASGTSTEQLARIGHKLMNLFNRCVEQGIGLGEHEARARAVIALLNANAKVQTFRYYEASLVRLPTLADTRAVNEMVCVLARKAVNEIDPYPARMGQAQDAEK